MITILISALLLLGGCKDNFDDSQLWKGVDEIYNQLTELNKQVETLNTQVELLSVIVNNGVITSISENSDGGYTVFYKGTDNVEHSVVIAAKADVVTTPILGTKLDNGELYWTLTTNGKTDYLKDTDGSKIPVGGRTPEIGVDANGYWTINGRQIKDSAGNPVKAEGKETSLITGVTVDDEGNANFTLGDGTTVSAPVFDAFHITLSVGEEAIAEEYVVKETAEPLTINYSITGKNAAETLVKLMRQESLTAAVDTSAKTITVTMGETFEEGSFMLLVCDAEENILIRRISIVAESAKPAYYGIKTAEDLRKFAEAVNLGRNIDRYRNQSGDVVLLQDVDMTGVESWMAIGTTEKPFTGTFDGQGYSIQNIAWANDASTSLLHGLFGVVSEATIKNLTLGKTGDRLTLTGKAAAGTAVGAIAAIANQSTITACTNNLSIRFEGEDPASTLLMLGGIVGQINTSTIGGDTQAEGCTNRGDITCGAVANTGNGGTGVQVAGICGYAKTSAENRISYCTNYGKVNAPSGRGGGLVGTLEKGTLTHSTNNGLVEDDAVGQYAGATDKYGIKRMGGLVGGSTGSAADCVIDACTNAGNVISHLGCRTGGFVGHNTGTITNCKNTGSIIANTVTESATALHGPGWACGYNKSATLIKGCTGNGHVGDYDTYKAAPETAPAAMHTTAVCQSKTSYDTEENTVDWTLDAYYDWQLKSTRSLHAGVEYSYYEFSNLPRKMHVLALDLTNEAVELSTSMSDDAIPNPNGNDNNNNGKNIRETLSENCARKRAEGENIVAGINTGFFNSHYGFPRGLHIEEGRPDFVNNKEARESLVNHLNCFTFFKDRSVSCGKKTFSGMIEVDGSQYEYYSINDTILRRGHATLMANLYTARYKEIPHSDHPELTNPLPTTALYVVAKNTSGKSITVNDGWIEATVTQVADGRTTALSKAPYLTAMDEWAIQLTGATAETLAGKLTVGASIKVRADVTVDGKSTPILTQNSTMYQLMVDGADKSGSNGLIDPMTYVGIDKTGTKVYLIVIDGRQDWVSMGVQFYECYRIAQKLGCWNVTRFDGGGSTAMWVYDDSTQSGALVNKPSDKNGERSCMNYMHVRIKK